MINFFKKHECKILDGKLVSNKIKEDIANQVKEYKEKYDTVPSLVAIQVGDNPASNVYVRNKVKACEKCGFISDVIKLPEETTEQELIKEIEHLNYNPRVNGFIVQLPLPKHINENNVINAIDPIKDVDGFTLINQGKLITNYKSDDASFIPATPFGIIKLLKYYNIELAGKNAVVVGRSNIVGKPIATLLMKENATVTICHSKTSKKDLEKYLNNADIIIAAVGKPNFIKTCKRGAVVVDVGINRDENNKLIGDVDFDALKYKASYISPVPGGVGPMTIAGLMLNTLSSFKTFIKQNF